jgi:hypothetical protein
MQAMSIRAAVEHFRRVEGCRGALFWQLNDIAVFPSWSSIEYDGRWKLLHHLSRRFFAPTLISGFVTPSSTLDIFLSGDGTTDGMSVDWGVDLVRWSDGTSREVERGTAVIRLGPQRVASLRCDLARGRILGAVASPVHFYARLWMHPNEEDGNPDEEEENFVFFTDFQGARLSQDVSVEHKWVGDGVLEVSAEHGVAAWVTVEIPGCSVSDSGFFLRPGFPRSLRCSPTPSSECEPFVTCLQQMMKAHE